LIYLLHHCVYFDYVGDDFTVDKRNLRVI
jgi:hypothetical protein